MKRVIFFKRIDLWGLVSAIFVPWLFFILIPDGLRLFHLEHLISGYFIVWVYLIASCLINKFKLHQPYRIKGRRWFEQSLLAVLVLVLASIMLKVFIWSFILLLYITPVLAVWYVAITVTELGRLKKPIFIIDKDITDTDLQ